MTVSEKIKTTDDKIEQSKAQYNSDTQTANISALSSENRSRYEFLTSEDVLLEKNCQKKMLQSKDLKIPNKVVS